MRPDSTNVEFRHRLYAQRLLITLRFEFLEKLTGFIETYGSRADECVGKLRGECQSSVIATPCAILCATSSVSAALEVPTKQKDWKIFGHVYASLPQYVSIC